MSATSGRLTKGRHKEVYQIRAQFLPEYFQAIPPAPSHSKKPFRIMYIGRIIRLKGVFDILEMARKIEFRHPVGFAGKSAVGDQIWTNSNANTLDWPWRTS